MTVVSFVSFYITSLSLTTGWGLIPGIYLFGLGANLTLLKTYFNEVPVCRNNNQGWDVLIGLESSCVRLERDHSNMLGAAAATIHRRVKGSNSSWRRMLKLGTLIPAELLGLKFAKSAFCTTTSAYKMVFGPHGTTSQPLFSSCIKEDAFTVQRGSPVT